MQKYFLKINNKTTFLTRNLLLGKMLVKIFCMTKKKHHEYYINLIYNAETIFERVESNFEGRCALVKMLSTTTASNRIKNLFPIEESTQLVIQCPVVIPENAYIKVALVALNDIYSIEMTTPFLFVDRFQAFIHKPCCIQ